MDEEQRRDTEEGGRDQTLYRQPEGCGEVHQICGHGSEPSLHSREPQVKTGAAGCRCCSWLLLSTADYDLIFLLWVAAQSNRGSVACVISLCS